MHQWSNGSEVAVNQIADRQIEECAELSCAIRANRDKIRMLRRKFAHALRSIIFNSNLKYYTYISIYLNLNSPEIRIMKM